MQTGVVGYYNDEKGYGFIKVEGQERDIFFHISAISQDHTAWRPNKGDEVTFESEVGEKGPQAVRGSVAPAGASDDSDESDADADEAADSDDEEEMEPLAM